MYTIEFAKEDFKFACAHFTIFGPARAERLHGHNYRVRLNVQLEDLDPSLGLAFDFNAVKPIIRAECGRLDERILLPTRSGHLKVEELGRQMDVKFAGKHYSFPAGDTMCLPLVNITSEELARHLCERIHEGMEALPLWTGLEVGVEEMRGQNVRFARRR